MSYEVKDIGLAPSGEHKIDWVRKNCPLLRSLEEDFKKELPFRTAYKLVGEIVNYSIKNDKTLDELTIEEYKSFNELFEEDIYDEIDLINCVQKRGLM